MGNFEHIGARIKSERERLNVGQVTICEAMGITRKTQFNYETGARSPDAEYLLRFAKMGADVLYILTGQRSQPQAPEELLPEDEQIMLDNYRHAPQAVQMGIKTTLGAFAASADKKVKRSA